MALSCPFAFTTSLCILKMYINPPSGLRYISALILSLFLLIPLRPAYPQSEPRDSYVINRWGMEHGLPQSSVNDFIQTRDGYIWLATFGGLVRFDGVQFTTFDRSNTQGLSSDRILRLYEDPDGSIWIGTEMGFLRWQSGSFETFFFEIDSQYFSPRIAKFDNHNALWVVVDESIRRFNGLEFDEIIPERHENLAIAALADSAGTWLATNTEIFKTTGTDAIFIADASHLITSEIVEILEFPKNSGIVFIASSRNGILRYENGNFQQFTQDHGLPSLWTHSMIIDNSGRMWVASFNGISYWNGSRFTSFDALDAVEPGLVTRLMNDNEGNYWAGTAGNGLFRFRPSIITNIDQTRGLSYELMLSLTNLNDGTALFATNCGGVFHWDGARATPAPVNDYLPNLCIWSVLQDSEGWIWMGSRGLYKTRSINEPGFFYDASNGFDCGEVFAMEEDSSGNLWIGCLDGLFKYQNDTFHKFTSNEGLSYNDVRSIFEDNAGNLWIGTSIGLNKMVDGVITPISLFGNLSIPEPYIRAVYQDTDGTMWFGSYGHGIFRIKNGAVSQITRASGLFDNVVSHLVEDAAGNFWMGSNRGISRVRKNDLNAYSDGRLARVQSYSYGTADGMKSAETNGGFQPSVISDNRGNLYFPTVAGVAVVAVNDVTYNEVPPPVFLESLFSGATEVPMQDVITLGHDNAYLQINYTALSFRDPEKIQFRYMMEGLDNTWFDVGSSRSALYTQIPPGQYTFRVLASNNDGVWNTDGTSLSIVVTPPFWGQTWFRMLVLLGIYGSVVGFFYLRVNRLQKVNETKRRFSQQLIESQELERKRIAAELHDGLGQQILVIKNRVELARLQIDNKEALQKQLDEIADSASDSIRDVRNISHALRPVHLEKFGITEALTSLCDELQQTTGIEWSYLVDNIDGLIPSGQEINIYRVIQEATSNIQHHSSANNASVMISRKQKSIQAVIWDDGIGIDKDDVAAKKGTLAGFGLQGMFERIESLGGHLTMESTPGNGTVIKFEIFFNV
jgi:signal transduction histidine kinase/ligand-binding sensor domain-containing protein